MNRPLDQLSPEELESIERMARDSLPEDQQKQILDKVDDLKKRKANHDKVVKFRETIYLWCSKIQAQDLLNKLKELESMPTDSLQPEYLLLLENDAKDLPEDLARPILDKINALRQAKADKDKVSWSCREFLQLKKILDQRTSPGTRISVARFGQQANHRLVTSWARESAVDRFWITEGVGWTDSGQVGWSQKRER